MKQKEYFQIRRKDGMLSKGGQCPKFGKTGKTWTGIGYVKAHIRQLRDGTGIPPHNTVRPTSVGGYTIFSHIYENCEVVTYVTVEDSIIPVNNLLNDIKKA